MRSLGLLVVICGLLTACAVHRAPLYAIKAHKLANEHPEDGPHSPTIVVVERVEVPTGRARKEASRTNAAPIFVRSSTPLSQYKLEQSTDKEALETKQRILDAMAESAAVPNDGAAVTVITRGDKAILFGRLASDSERKLIENIAAENAKRVESHIRVRPTK